tara:strand:+ start:190 stop:495 length:306 start_codon:yes stop_codon:yes gene_type:complete
MPLWEAAEAGERRPEKVYRVERAPPLVREVFEAKGYREYDEVTSAAAVETLALALTLILTLILTRTLTLSLTRRRTARSSTCSGSAAASSRPSTRRPRART